MEARKKGAARGSSGNNGRSVSTNDPINKPPAKGRRKGAAAKSKAPEKPAGQRDEVDLFIDEVTEELQKDRAYKVFRRYGPYVGAAIVVIVLAAAVNEYLSAAATERARVAGAALIERLESDAAPEQAAAALAQGAETVDAPASALFHLQQAAQLEKAGDLEGALAAYGAVAARDDLSPLYRDLAVLRGAMAGFETKEPQEIIAELSLLTSPGRPYRPLALELTALAEVRDGRVEDARATLTRIIEASETPGYLHQRASQLLEAIGGEPPSAERRAPQVQAIESD